MSNKTSISRLPVWVLLLLFTLTTNGQNNFSILPIKEKYDDIFIGAYDYPPSVYSFGNLTDTVQFDNVTQHGGVMESMLVMYEVTKDKAYLYKFMEWTVALFLLKGSSNSFVDISLYQKEENKSIINFNARLL